MSTHAGTLFVIATPIGNMDDISARARDTLGKVDLVAAEDTRRAGQLLTRLGIRNRLVSLHEQNETERVEELASALAGLGADDVRSGGGGADISPLGREQVPLMNLRQDTTHYFDYHHSAADTLDKVDPGDLARNVAAMAVMAYLLADSETPLPRLLPPSPPEHRMHPDSK